MAVRNLKNEATRILSTLSTREKYNMFEIVLEQMGKRQSPEKQSELKAMYDAIVHARDTDVQTLFKMEKGHSSLLSDDVRGGTLKANNNPKKKKS